MTAIDWAALTVSITTIAAAFAGGVRWLVKHYLYELRPNGGGSVKDQVNRLEARVDEIYLLLCEKKQNTSRIFFSNGNIFIFPNACTSSSARINGQRCNNYLR